MSDHRTAHRNLTDSDETFSRRHSAREPSQRGKRRIYSESLSALNEAYVTQTLRLIELETAGINNMNRIDRLLRRLAAVRTAPVTPIEEAHHTGAAPNVVNLTEPLPPNLKSRKAPRQACR